MFKQPTSQFSASYKGHDESNQVTSTARRALTVLFAGNMKYCFAAYRQNWNAMGADGHSLVAVLILANILKRA